MQEEVLSKFEDMFSDINNFTPEKLESLIKQILETFKEIKVKLDSKDEKEKAEAVETLILLKAKIQEYAEEIYRNTQMSSEQIKEFIENPKNFNQDEWRSLGDAQKELEDYKEEMTEIAEKPTRKKKKAKPRKGKKHWVQT